MENNNDKGMMIFESKYYVYKVSFKFENKTYAYVGVTISLERRIKEIKNDKNNIINKFITENNINFDNLNYEILGEFKNIAEAVSFEEKIIEKYREDKDIYIMNKEKKYKICVKKY